MSSIVFLLEDDWNEKIVVSEWAMSLSGLQNERMPDRWDNIGGKISTETQNKTALTEGTSIKTERKWPHGWTKHVIWSYTSYPPITHTQKYKHTYIYSFIVMGGEVVRYGSREESQPRTVGLPYAVVDFGISSPLDAGFWIVFPHIYIRNGSHRAVLSTPSHMIECHPHPHIHILYNILYNYCFSIYFVSVQF